MSEANGTTTLERAGAVIPKPARSASRFVGPALIIVTLLAVILGAAWYLHATANQVSTDDAFTDGRSVSIAPKVSGYVTRLAVTDNQRVSAGDVLLEIDPRDYVIARDRAAAALHVNQAQLESAQIALNIAKKKFPDDLASAAAQRDLAAASLIKARADLQRQQAVDIRATTPQAIDAAQATMRTATANLADAEAKLNTARLVADNIASAESDVAEKTAEVEQAQSQLAQAELDLAQTKVVAPQDGWVTKRNVEKGNYLQIGSAIMSLVSPDVWITANFKETQLTQMRPGQPVTIEIDAYPQLKLTGVVDSVQMGTGSRFTAFPAENATGNYIKIVQRLPVKIRITGGLDPSIPLPLGLSALPTVMVATGPEK